MWPAATPPISRRCTTPICARTSRPICSSRSIATWRLQESARTSSSRRERLAQKGGKTYAIPYTLNARALFYNGKLLREAGLQPPANVDEFMAAIRKLRKPEAQQFGYATISKPGAANLVYIEIMPIVMGFGGGFFKDGKPSANTPETIAALKFIKTLYDEQLIPRGMDTTTYRQLFVQGKVGMYATGSFFAGVVASGDKETYANLGARPLPLPTDRTMSLTAFFAIPKGAKNKDAAGKLLMRLLKEDIQASIVTTGKTYPGANRHGAGEFCAGKSVVQGIRAGQPHRALVCARGRRAIR